MKRWIVCMLLVVGVFTAAGCEKPLFPENQPRTQYERYDRLRGRYVPTEAGPAGGREPALRERLGPSSR